MRFQVVQNPTTKSNQVGEFGDNQQLVRAALQKRAQIVQKVQRNIQKPSKSKSYLSLFFVFFFSYFFPIQRRTMKKPIRSSSLARMRTACTFTTSSKTCLWRALNGSSCETSPSLWTNANKSKRNTRTCSRNCTNSRCPKQAKRQLHNAPAKWTRYHAHRCS